MRVQQEVWLFQDFVCSELLTFDTFLYDSYIRNHFQVHILLLQAASSVAHKRTVNFPFKMKSLRLGEV